MCSEPETLTRSRVGLLSEQAIPIQLLGEINLNLIIFLSEEILMKRKNCAEICETQVLHISVQKELSERQNRQEIDLLTSFGKRLQENEV